MLGPSLNQPFRAARTTIPAWACTSSICGDFKPNSFPNSFRWMIGGLEAWGVEFPRLFLRSRSLDQDQLSRVPPSELEF